MEFVEKCYPDRRDLADQCERARALVAEHDLSQIRLSFADQHGVLRGKTIVRNALEGALKSGVNITSTLLLKDTSHKTIFPIWSQRESSAGHALFYGGEDIIMAPDPATFRVLPWTNGTGWMLCDLFRKNGEPIAFSSRAKLQQALKALDACGYDYVCGLEMEFHIYRMIDPKLDPSQIDQPSPPPDVLHTTQGYQYLTENRFDQIEDILVDLNTHCELLDLPVRTLELEFGPSQVEVTFEPRSGIETADNALLFRAAVKQICQRKDLHATFMCRPNLPRSFSSGWHLHQSLTDKNTSQNLFSPESKESALSSVGERFLAGILAHAEASCVFTTPTINGYKRYQPFSLAPDRIAWGKDNRGAMLRVIGGAGDEATRIENRAGEPAANPYLYLMSQILSGLDGLERKLQPPPPTDEPYNNQAVGLPGSLSEAVQAFLRSDFYRAKLGDDFVAYLAQIKQAEIERYRRTVTDWEQQEYFGLF